MLIGGVWADRLERHRVMIVTDVVRALAARTLAVLIFIGPVPIWAIVVIEAAFGTAEAFFKPAVTGLVPQTVPEGEVQQANAANSIVAQRGRARRPGDRHRARARARRGLGVRDRRATFVVSALLLSRCGRARAASAAARQPMLRAELRAGWRELRSRQWAWVVIVATSVALLVSLAPFLHARADRRRGALRRARASTASLVGRARQRAR